jgi:hypothetical protein
MTLVRDRARSARITGFVFTRSRFSGQEKAKL